MRARASGTRKDAERDFWFVEAADSLSSVSRSASKPLGSTCEDVTETETADSKAISEVYRNAPVK